MLATIDVWEKKLVCMLTGGEPFLSPNLFRLAKFLDKSDIVAKWGIITNGVIPDRINALNRLRDEFEKFDALYVSLDGTRESVNRKIRAQGIFARVIDTMTIARSRGLKVYIMFTLMKSNLEDAYNLPKFAQELADGFILERFIPLGQSAQLKHEVVSGEELMSVYKEIYEFCNVEFNPIDAVKYHALFVRFDKENNLFGAECVIGRLGACILPCGTLLPCRRLYLPLGNLLKESLLTIWRENEILQKLTQKTYLKGKCKICSIGDCAGCRAIAWAIHGDPFGEDPQCFALREVWTKG